MVRAVLLGTTDPSSPLSRIQPREALLNIMLGLIVPHWMDEVLRRRVTRLR